MVSFDYYILRMSLGHEIPNKPNSNQTVTNQSSLVMNLRLMRDPFYWGSHDSRQPINGFQMLISLTMLLAGMICLYFGAEWLVSATASLAAYLGIPVLIVGLTVVAFGTSAPEVVVGVYGSLSGHGSVVLGNAVGSNLANMGLILGFSSMLTPAKVQAGMIRREIPFMVLSPVLLLLFLADGEMTRLEGICSITLMLTYTGLMVRDARRSMREASSMMSITQAASEDAGGLSGKTPGRLAAISILGLLVLMLGGHLFVSGAVDIARSLGMSERLVGLTIVAVGTSLPELATSVLAAVRGHSDVVVGNVVGSNIFNILLCLGISAVVSPVYSDAAATRDMFILLGACLGVSFLIRGDRVISRREGLLLLLAYLLYMASLMLPAAPPGQ